MKFLPAGAGAVSTTVQAKLRERVSVLDFGADPTGAANSLTEVQAAYNFVANQDGGEVYWPKGSYTINGTIYFGANTRTDLGKSTITGNGSVLFATGYLSGGALAANFGTANNCDKSSIENGTIYNTNGIAFKLTNFRFYCYLSNIVCYDVAQIAVGDSCFYSDYRNLIYFGATDFVKSTAKTTSASAVIVVTNAVAATLSAGM